MRAYAVVSGNPKDNAALEHFQYPWILQSFTGTFSETLREEVLTWEPHGLMLDSGAFSVWNAGYDAIKILDLSDWASRQRALFPGTEDVLLVNLDVIPGERGRRATAAETASAASASAANAEVLREHGHKVMEVYHGGEPFEFLVNMLGRRRPGEVVAVGGMGALTEREKVHVCDAVFAHLRDTDGWAALSPLHGLGMAPTSPLATRYPWFSGDASSWFMPVHYGHEAGRGGKRIGSRLQSDKAAVRASKDFSLIRTVRSWAEREKQLTALWQARGVAFKTEGATA